MNGKINTNGNLCIGRAGIMAVQYCPFTNGEPEFCGDWCPLFGEPVATSMIQDRFDLELCHRTLNFEEFTDEREEDETVDHETFGTGQNQD